MKCSYAVLIAILVLSAASSVGFAQEEPAPPCAVAAWSPEVLQFYGDMPAINKKLAQYDATIGLDVRRVFLVIVEDESGAQVSYFERDAENEDNRKVLSWTTESAKDFKAALEQSLHDRKGKGCAGLMAHDLLSKEGADKLKPGAPLRGKVSAAGAVKHVAPKATDDKGYKSVTIIVLC